MEENESGPVNRETSEPTGGPQASAAPPRDREELFRLLIENVKDYALFTTDPSGRVTSWNTGAERTLGYQEQEILGQDARIVFTPEDQARGEPERELQTAAATGRAEDERWHIRKDGTRFWCSGVVSALLDERGTLRGFAKVMRDITARKELEEALRQRSEALEAADQAKDQFMALLGHELRNPLGSLSNALFLIEHRAKDPSLSSPLEVCRRQIQYLTRLVDDLLEVSRIGRGMLSLQRVRLDLGLVIRNAVEDTFPVTEEAGVTLSLELPDAPVWVQGDPVRLAQIVGNLIHNAAKFTNPGGQITVRLRVEGPASPESAPPEHAALSSQLSTAVLRVQDTGAGLSPEMLSRVFDLFTQARPDRDRQQGGLGLGLALVKGLVQLHGGQVRAESEGPGRGSVFTVRLPLDPGPTASG
jgi:PAS domain S-box-containing protein